MPDHARRFMDRLRTVRGLGQRADDAALVLSERAMRLVREYETNGDGWFWQTDRGGRLTYLSDKVERALRVDADDIAGVALTDLFLVDSDMPHTERTLAFHLTSRTAFRQYTVRPAGDDRDERRWSISGSPVIDAWGNFDGFVGTGSDLTAQALAEAEITRLALFDGLTGLANRQRMRQSLDQTLIQSQATYRPLALLLLDLDRFKAVNDTLGHPAGDALLKQVAQRLLRVVGEEGLVGRLGGDEFQVILPQPGTRDHIARLSRDIIAALSQPYFVADSSVTIGCSIGVAMAPDDAQDADMLTRNADLALYAAKADGRGVHRFFAEAMLEGAQTRKQLEEDLRHALVQDQLAVLYQPIVATGAGRVTGFEALIRWTHPVRGAVSPAEFIPIAEECGLIDAIGEWVLKTACEEAARWSQPVRVAVNVSPIQFGNANLCAIVTRSLAQAGLDPARLELEITEGVLLNASAQTERTLAALKDLGVRLALDDFGTGYSSFGLLSRAPVDKIKMDQSFVRGAALPGNRNAAIIKAIVTLADALAIETTAEGIEVQDEIALMHALGCTSIQGYVFGKPMTAAAAQAMLGADGGAAQPCGHRISRPVRTTILRRVVLSIDGREFDVRLRNVSPGGAMLDGLTMIALPTDAAVRVWLGDAWLTGSIRWHQGGRAGLAWQKPFDLALLNSAPARRTVRRA